MSTAATLFAIGVITYLVITLVMKSLPAWSHAGSSFISGREWFYRQEKFGAAPMIYGSLVVALIAIGLATPIAIGAAIFSAEYLPARARLALKIVVELLAGIPSVVYGLLGVLLLRDWVYEVLQRFDPLSGDTLLTAGLLLAVMILPTIMTLSDDALRSVPSTQRLAARGLGLTRTETILSLTLPQARPGLIAAVLLALGRALGEMIAVFLVVGRRDNQWPETLGSLRPLMEAGQTLASKLGGAETNIAYGQPLHWGAMMGLGVLLLSLGLGMTLLAVMVGKLNRRRSGTSTHA
jgi:phosphate transport system permease protein